MSLAFRDLYYETDQLSLNRKYCNRNRTCRNRNELKTNRFRKCRNKFKKCCISVCTVYYFHSNKRYLEFISTFYFETIWTVMLLKIFFSEIARLIMNLQRSYNEGYLILNVIRYRVYYIESWLHICINYLLDRK